MPQNDPQNNDDRKRSFDNSENVGAENTNHEAQGKRIRQPEEILNYPEDPRRPSTRLLINKQEFSKVIGKGGNNISQIRQTCGAGVRGIDIDDNTRILIISGSPKQVLEAFEMVSENLYQHHLQIMMSPQSFIMQLLVDNQKAGRIIGPSGTNIHALKSRTGATQLRLQKDVKVSILNVFAIEISHNSIKYTCFIRTSLLLFH